MSKKLTVLVFIFSAILSAETATSVSKKLINNNKDSFTRATPLPPTDKTINKKITISQATIKAINKARATQQICSKPVQPLRWNKILYSRAKEHAIDMAVTGKLQHNGTGTNTDKTAKYLGLKRGSFFYERVNQKKDSQTFYSGELIIRTSEASLKSPKDLISYWLKRPKDCKVIMDSKFSDVALAKVISNKDNRAYWTLVLAGAVE